MELRWQIKMFSATEIYIHKRKFERGIMIGIFKNLHTQASAVDSDENIWTFSNDINALFVFRKNSYKPEYVCQFEENFFSQSLYTSMKCINGKLLLTPCAASNFVSYDINTGKTSYYPILKPPEVYFNTVVTSEQKVIMFPVRYYDHAYLYDLKKNRFSEIAISYPDDFDDSWKDMSPLFIGEAYVENAAVFCIVGSNMYLEFNYNNGIALIKKTQLKEKLYKVAGAQNRLYFMNLSGDKLVYMENGSVKKTVSLPVKERTDIFLNGIGMGFGNIVLNGGKIYCVPFRGNVLIIYDIENNKVNGYGIDWSLCGMTENRQPFSDVDVIGNSAVFLPYQGNSVARFDSNSGEIDYYDGQIQDSDRSILAQKLLDELKGSVLSESDTIISLNDFISCVIDNDDNYKTYTGNVDIGKIIYNEVSK